MAVHTGLLRITLEFEGANSLKEKRRVIKSLIDRARRQLRVSIAEVGFQNRIRSSEVAIAFVGSNRYGIMRARSRAENLFCSDPRADPIEISWEWL